MTRVGYDFSKLTAFTTKRTMSKEQEMDGKSIPQRDNVRSQDRRLQKLLDERQPPHSTNSIQMYANTGLC